MKRFAILSVLLVAPACGPKATKGTVGPKGYEPPTDYAALFEKGKTWAFTVKTADDVESEESETGFQHVEDSHDTTCTVSEVTRVQGRLVSKIDCEDLQTSGVNSPLSGLWIADGTGIYHLGDSEMPAAGEKLEYNEDKLIFQVPPQERDQQEKDPEMGDDPVSETSVEHKDGNWCYSWSTAMGDSAWIQMCVGPDGPINGSFGWAGGSSHEANFELKK